jgi:DNA-binding MarR family transcriptional regulator
MAVKQMLPLSKRQEQVLKFLYEFFEGHRFYPTQREIMDFLQVKGTTAVGYLGPLEKKGYIERVPGQGRNVLITELGYEKLEELGVKEGQPGLFGKI